MIGFVTIVSALPLFFFSALWLMLFWGIIAPWVDIRTINYAESMAATFGLWLAVVPVAFAVAKLWTSVAAAGLIAWGMLQSEKTAE